MYKLLIVKELKIFIKMGIISLGKLSKWEYADVK
tara:strand:+ start:1868 stop:1969 length:102 start_codon:yes stop_codon:yes gene_type:complete